ncbi:hypothetical protein [Pedobacter sp. P26]|uniref:hypothetical protein n=1 Tax=Pedobacter sp. P26 TaxID=3423956 RepID=UPI003D6686F7
MKRFLGMLLIMVIYISQTYATAVIQSIQIIDSVKNVPADSLRRWYTGNPIPKKDFRQQHLLHLFYLLATVLQLFMIMVH